MTTPTLPAAAISDKIHFGYIAPIAYLDLVPKNSKFHLCLAHLCKDKTYCEFYTKRRKAGDMIIMDNSAFEFGGSIEPEVLVDLIGNSGIEPHVVVAPDYPGQAAKVTITAFDKFAKYAEKAGLCDQDQLMAVPQSRVGDWKDWLRGYKTFRTNGVRFIGMSILALPNAAQGITGTTDISTNRLWATVELMQQGRVGGLHGNPWHHYLGAGSPSEYRMLDRLEQINNNHDTAFTINSSDTSSPIWHAINGIRYDNSATGLIKGKSKKHVNFDIKRADGAKLADIINNATLNIEYIQAALSNKPANIFAL